MSVTEIAIADVQSRPDQREIAIDKVGIRSLRHPVSIRNQDGTSQHSIAEFEMMVNLAKDVKGTHMSRFVDVLHAQASPYDVVTFQAMLGVMTECLGAQQGYITMHFPFFMKKNAPVSKVPSLLDYQASFIGKWTDGKAQTQLRVVVPVTSLCPCSKEISRYGAHNQRSHITITVIIQEPIAFESLIEMAESHASSELYGILKRDDERYITEKAYENPKFVEDMVRDVAIVLKQDPRILGFNISSENFESIHNHSAFAEISHQYNAW
jgi:GTP cyclohydrolase I